MNSESSKTSTNNRVVTIYASSSFVTKWGPGPALAALFEKQNNIKAEFIESSDVAMTLQKISFEGKNSIADVVVGLDQFDIARSAVKTKWKDIVKNSSLTYSPEITDLVKLNTFLAYDWAPMSFVARQDLPVTVEKLDDLLKPELKGKIALEDPRTSSPGLQLLIWIFENKSIADAKVFLKSLNHQAHSYSSGWSTAYGLFKNKQADLVFSYVTSPVYHLVEEKDSSYVSLEFKEPHSLQIEFAGIPDTCKNCEAANKFVQFLQSSEAQKILMTKNYMLPVDSKVKSSTAFDSIKVYKTKSFEIYDKAQLDEWIQIWSEVRKNEGF
ncbi:MAG: thiamine ABC transporter substrate-binding protein [Pseudobdellovibrio sp.]